MSLKGKTLFMSGGSRGIGLAIALKAARDGANVTIAAKTAEPHPKLPGTIYTAAEEIEAAGGKALPVLCDIREEAQVADAVAENCRAFRRHRHLRQQRQRHQPDRHAADRHEALRSDEPDQCARHLSGLQNVHSASEVGAKSSYSESGAAAGHEGEMVQGPRRLHDGEIRHVDVHARHERRVRRRTASPSIRSGR